MAGTRETKRTFQFVAIHDSGVIYKLNSLILPRPIATVYTLSLVSVIMHL